MNVVITEGAELLRQRLSRLLSPRRAIASPAQPRGRRVEDDLQPSTRK
jgi:hypothetical protein